MSLVIHLEQGTNKLNRLLYVHNNISEIKISHGITFYEAMENQNLDHPFEKYLPVNYNLHTEIEHLEHIYDTALILQMEIPVYEKSFEEVLLSAKNERYYYENMQNEKEREQKTKQSTFGDDYKR